MTPGLLVRSLLALLLSVLVAALALNHASIPPVSAINAALNDQNSGPVFTLPPEPLHVAASAPSPAPSASAAPGGAAATPGATASTPTVVPTQRPVVIKPGVQAAQNYGVPGHIFFDTPTHNIAFITGQHYRRLFTGTGDAVAPALSPGGRRLAWVYFKRNYSDIWITPLDLLPDGSVKALGGSIQLTQDQNPPASLQVAPAPPGYQPQYEWWATKPSWMPDGRHLLYISDRPGYDPNNQENAVMSVYQQGITDTMAGATRLSVAAAGTGGDDSPQWRPHDPTTFIYVDYNSGLGTNGSGIIEVNSALTGTVPAGNPTDLTPQGVTEYQPVWSPDGRYIAFVENKAGDTRSDLRVIPFTRPGTLGDYNKVVTVETGAPYIAQPFWSPDGRYLGYLRGGANGFVMVIRRVHEDSRHRLHFGPPRVLDQAGAVSAEYRPTWGP